MEANVLGAYGPFAAQILGDGPAQLSFRRACFDEVDEWRAKARSKALELIALPEARRTSEVEVVSQSVVDGVAVERLRWQLPYGPPTEAVFLKPERATGPLPGIVALHDHGGLKYFGWRKIADDGGPVHPIIRSHREECYGERAWANEIAKLGYAVICHDTFAFASRRVLVKDVLEAIRWGDARDVGPKEDEADIRAYNQWANQHEHIIAKSLFAAGTTWPAFYLYEDQVAVDILCAREEVDSERIGCCGLSGGGLRTVYLGGLDERIRSAVCAGMMTTWRDVVLQKCWTHTWMTWTPHLPKYLDYPEVLGLRVPLPTMVLNNTEDSLFTLAEMRRADEMLRSVYDKAGSPETYTCQFYPGPHKFDVQMQRDAFEWLDRWLKG